MCVGVCFREGSEFDPPRDYGFFFGFGCLGFFWVCEEGVCDGLGLFLFFLFFWGFFVGGGGGSFVTDLFF